MHTRIRPIYKILPVNDLTFPICDAFCSDAGGLKLQELITAISIAAIAIAPTMSFCLPIHIFVSEDQNYMRQQRNYAYDCAFLVLNKDLYPVYFRCWVKPVGFLP